MTVHGNTATPREEPAGNVPGTEFKRNVSSKRITTEYAEALCHGCPGLRYTRDTSRETSSGKERIDGDAQLATWRKTEEETKPAQRRVECNS
jgi:hypothetical protein